MTSTLIPDDKYPKRSFSGITQLGLTAFDLATLHKAVLEPRLPEGTIDDLADDLDALGLIVPAAKQVRAEARVSTESQDVAAQKGYARIRSFRSAMRKIKAPSDVRAAYGVGQDIHPLNVRDIKAGLQQILDRAAAKPTELASLGILQKDLDAIKAARSALIDADKTQEQKRAKVPLTTRGRNRTANRILLAVGRIAAAGGLEFADDPITLASFEALRVTPKAKAAKVADPEAPLPTPQIEPAKTP